MSHVLLTPRLTRRNLLLASAVISATGLSMRRSGSTYAVAPNATYAPFLDPTQLHSIDTTLDATEYDNMISTYESTGDKDWISATVVINGQAFENAGMRLKGNSSLGGFGRGERTNETATDGTPSAVVEPEFDQTDEFGGGGGSLANRDPQTLPWLIRLDRNVEDQTYNGITQFVIRSNNSQTSLNEAVALNLLDRAGLASQQAAYVAFTVNASEPTLRLAIEHPKDAWLEARFDKNGSLFKAEATGDYSYRGTDPASYTDVFELEAGGTGDDLADFGPLTSFLDFLNNATDAEFAAQIADRLDLDQFATYLAMMDLIGNTDDIDGPGNNSYLYVGPESEQFTVVPWDMNLAFGGMGMGGGNGQFQPRGGDQDGMFRPGDIPTNADGTPVVPDGGMMPMPGGTNVEGTPVDGNIIIVNGNPPDGIDFPQGGPGQGGGFGGRSNILVTRANALADFPGTVESTTAQLRTDLFEGGEARTILDTWVAFLVANAAEFVPEATVNDEAGAIATFFGDQ